MDVANDHTLRDPAYHVNRWGLDKQVQWHGVKVHFSATYGFCVKYCPNDFIPVDTAHPVAPSFSRPSSASSASSFQNKSSSAHQSNVAYSETRPSENELLRIPYNLVLCEDFLAEYAEKDTSWTSCVRWMEDTGHVSLKYAMIAFMCMGYGRLRTEFHEVAHRSSPLRSTSDIGSFPDNSWLGYVAFLPRFPGQICLFRPAEENNIAPLTVPTVWSEEEQKYLEGTSLKMLLLAKMKSLESGFKAFQEFVIENNHDFVRCIGLNDWIRFEACYLSRCLETPESGTCMVPCLDMINHSYKPNAHYVQDTESGDIILLKYDGTLGNDEEITINYAPENGAAESLMTYGFIDPGIVFNDRLTLLLSEPAIFPFPTGIEFHFAFKLSAFRKLGGDNFFIIRQNEEGEAEWEAPFAYVLALCVEDDIAAPDMDSDSPVDDSPTTESYRSLLLHKTGASGDLLKIDKVIEKHPQSKSIQCHAIEFIMRQVNSHIHELEKAVEITDELATNNSRISMCRRLRELEMGSLMAIQKELIKQLSAVRPGLASAGTGEITAAVDGLTIDD